MANETKNIGEIFHQRVFRIPDYQRGYSWTDQHRNAFWEDLLLLLKIGGGVHHYTGLIAIESLSLERARSVLSEGDLWLLSGNTTLCMVVDGQQRLTTLILFIHELLARHAELVPDEHAGLNATTRRVDVERTFIRKESLAVPGHFGYMFGYANNDSMDGFFRSAILGDTTLIVGGVPTSAYARQLNVAKAFFRTKFQSFDRPDELAKWFDLLQSRLLFNVFEVKDEFDVCLTFEAMNNRGKVLTDLEKLKSRVLYLSGLSANKSIDLAIRTQQMAHYRRAINDAWTKTYEVLGWTEGGVLDDDKFLQMAWVLRYGKPGESRNSHLFSELFTAQRALDGDVWPDISTFSKDLATLAAPWAVIERPREATSLRQRGWLAADVPEDIVSRLERLNQLDVSNFAPLLTAGLVHFQTKEISAERFMSLIAGVERYAMLVFGLAERQANTDRNVFMRMASELYQAPSNILNTLEYLETQSNFRYEPELFETRIRSRQIPGGSQRGFYDWDCLKYALYEYEVDLRESRFSRDTPKLSFRMLQQQTELIQSIEHIFPQTPKDGEWPSFEAVDGADTLLVTNSLGNLLLISGAKNSTLRNDAYKKKAFEGDTRYANGSFSEIAVATAWKDWTPQAVYARSEELLNFIGRQWRVPSWGRSCAAVLLPLEKYRPKDEVTDAIETSTELGGATRTPDANLNPLAT